MLSDGVFPLASKWRHGIIFGLVVANGQFFALESIDALNVVMFVAQLRFVVSVAETGRFSSGFGKYRSD